MNPLRQNILADFQDAVRDGYQRFLEELGFVSYKDDLIHWYLLRGDVLFSLQMQTPFYSPASMYPIFAAKPLFIKTMIPAPLVSTDLYGINSFHLDFKWQHFYRRLPIHYPRGEHFGGVPAKEWIKSYLRAIQTPEDAFEQRKALCRSRDNPYLTEDFVDEVIYYRDEEFWERAIQTKENYFLHAPGVDEAKNPYAIRHRAQLRALEDPLARLEYVAELEKNKNVQLATLRKKVPSAIHVQPFI